MPSRATKEHIVECFLPGLREDDVLAIDLRALAAVAELAEQGEDVSYVGSLVIPEDEVLLCRFSGSTDAVCRAAERAAIPFERIVAACSWLGRSDDDSSPERARATSRTRHVTETPNRSKTQRRKA